ncbi:MAG: inorganic phosphate transporter [Bacteroidales bacterium]|jgi:PiT family inorganic phosphate transporter|nr:inorganic phosphate transporter [Bacteroidales bacterium]MDD2687384.1 inorganic phosphate transporter [Bacteroidales bacterium]MDD3329910.1 inorganic phosphate transporter [Bacteroidales bacterium]MDD3691157.1 inorganic phosphate transporter [Bacteroidales bacterium]MDD4044182.1 inorganic phosphate transporter [Bacteroidales bacterium]
MDTTLIIIIIGIIIAFLFDFLNGMNDAANSIATIVATKVLTPFQAVLWAAFFNFAAVFVFHVGVANTVGNGIVQPQIVNEYVIISAIIGAVLWVFFCTKFGLPISVSHALIGGLIGPALFFFGTEALVFSGIFKVLLFIVLSPLLGLLLGYFIMILTMRVFRKANPNKVEHLFRYLQLVSSAVFSLGHGSNDAQKTMGIITMLLVSAGYLETFEVPNWVIISCYTCISLGTLVGGWKVIRTLGDKLTALKPVQGFCAETAGAVTLIGTALGGIPVSTTHTITGSIVGVGVTRRMSAVRWGTTKNIVWAWLFTIPVAMLMSGGIYWVFTLFI